MPRGQNKRRCRAQTKEGKRCRNGVVSGRDLCTPHAGLNVPGEAGRNAGRACTAATKRGRTCRKWAVRGSDPPLCAAHGARPGPRGRRRCQARTRDGKRCRGWAARASRSGKALCGSHATGYHRPGPEEGCTASTRSGEPCGKWAVRGSAQQYGARLCSSHLPDGDRRKVRTRLPGPGERRCRAITLDGTRCAHWAMAGEGAGGLAHDLCWIHAFPHLHPSVTHGYYRARPLFTPWQQAAILRLAEEEGPLTAELILVRLKVRGVFAYLGREDVSAAEKSRTGLLLWQAVRAVSRLLRAQKMLVELNWGAQSVGNTGKMLEYMARREER